MKKIFSLALIFFLTLSFPALAAEGIRPEGVRPDNPRAGFEERRRAVAEMMEAATVWIVTENDRGVWVGSGFIVGAGYIATNAHVIEDVQKRGDVYVLNEKIPVRKAQIVNSIHEDKSKGASGRDLALLRFDPPKGVEFPILSFNFDVKRMDRVSAWGYPDMATRFDISTERLRQGNMNRLEPPPVIYTEGTVNAIVNDRRGSSILHSASIAGGNSGGPLVNGRGEVVGMNTWGYTEEDEGAFLNGAQLAVEIAAFLADSGIAPRLAPGQQLTASPPRRETEQEPAKPGVSGGKLPGRWEPREERRRDVGDFSVMVPRGWSVLDEEHNTILVGADDDSSAVGILVAEMEGQSLRQVARTLSRELEGTAPELDDDFYMFTYTDDGVDTMVVVGEIEDEDMYVVIFVSGDWEAPGVEAILDSLE